MGSTGGSPAGITVLDFGLHVALTSKWKPEQLPAVPRSSHFVTKWDETYTLVYTSADERAEAQFQAGLRAGLRASSTGTSGMPGLGGGGNVGRTHVCAGTFVSE
jgi:hypothetical protein